MLDLVCCQHPNMPYHTNAFIKKRHGKQNRETQQNGTHSLDRNKRENVLETRAISVIYGLVRSGQSEK